MALDSKGLGRYKNHFARINEEIEKSLISRVPLIEDMGKHSLLGNGKRLRPLFFILSCQLCNYQGDDVYHLSTIFEYLHTASLLHDDVLDNAEIRRNKPSANHLWGNQAAVLEGDFLASKSSSIAVGTNNMSFVKRLLEVTIQMAEGQVLELIHTDDWNTTKDEYMEIISAKTAGLISAACVCGAIISGVETEAEESLAGFGMNVGIAFQLMDDVLDYTSSQEEFGKPVGKDLREGKITLPLIYTLPKLGGPERKRLENLFINGQATEEDYQELIGVVRNNGAIGRVLDEARSYVDKAAHCLDTFPESPAKTTLLELSRYIIERTF